jgi:hypothetical protein
MKRLSITKGLAATGIVVGMLSAGVVAAAPAQAAQSDCRSGYACNWRDTGYTTFMTPFQYYIDDYGYFGMHDTISSVYNNGNYMQARFWESEGFRGAWFTLPLKAGDSQMHDGSGYAPGWGDRIDSGKFV